MNEITAFFWILVLFTLRIGLPITAVLLGGHLLNAFLDRHQEPVNAAR